MNVNVDPDWGAPRGADGGLRSGRGPLGFAGTVIKETVAAAGLTTLSGDEFGGGPKMPMVPGTLESRGSAGRQKSAREKAWRPPQRLNDAGSNAPVRQPLRRRAVTSLVASTPAGRDLSQRDMGGNALPRQARLRRATSMSLLRGPSAVEDLLELFRPEPSSGAPDQRARGKSPDTTGLLMAVSIWSTSAATLPMATRSSWMMLSSTCARLPRWRTPSRSS